MEVQQHRYCKLTLTASVARPDSRYDLMASGSRGSAPLVCLAVTVKSTGCVKVDAVRRASGKRITISLSLHSWNLDPREGPLSLLYYP